MSNKFIFIDRDGTLIDEPSDKQIDCLSKLRLKNDVIPALINLRNAGYALVMVSNQDGLGTPQFKQSDFEPPHKMLLSILQTQGIIFEDILICPHTEEERCDCRKPKLGLMIDYLKGGKIDYSKSYVIGDRQTDLKFAENIGITGIQYNDEKGWLKIAKQITDAPRQYQVERSTLETKINVMVELDQCNDVSIDTGIGFFNHMLEQLAKHGGFNLSLKTEGDLMVDEHHTIEDTAIALGTALRGALGDKLGINRYGFVLPMDESRAEVTIDLSGRSYFVFEGEFKRESVGTLPTELIPHFFRSFSDGLQAAIHIKVIGENTHHMIESIFKSVGRALRQAIFKQGYNLPTTKGVL